MRGTASDPTPLLELPPVATAQARVDVEAPSLTFRDQQRVRTRRAYCPVCRAGPGVLCRDTEGNDLRACHVARAEAAGIDSNELGTGMNMLRTEATEAAAVPVAQDHAPIRFLRAEALADDEVARLGIDRFFVAKALSPRHCNFCGGPIRKKTEFVGRMVPLTVVCVGCAQEEGVAYAGPAP